jgi:hypothetical protein
MADALAKLAELWNINREVLPNGLTVLTDAGWKRSRGQSD